MAAPERRPSGLTKAPTKAHPLAPAAPAPTPAASSVTDSDRAMPAAAPTKGPKRRSRNDGAAPAKAGKRLGPATLPKASATGEGPFATLSARVPIELRDEIKVYAARHRLSVQDLVIAAVQAYLDV